MALTDLVKTCDVPIEIIWKEMENIDINPILIKATTNLYKKNTTIKVRSKLTKEFKTMKVLDRDVACSLYCSKFIWTEPYKDGKLNVETWD
jgi:hypothetical protein